MQRRGFIRFAALSALFSSAVTSTTALAKAAWQRINLRYLRPPGALPEAEFASACIRCGQCAEVCPNQCIQFFDASAGLDKMDTPYIVPREKACILCMKCGDACPSGALAPIEREVADIVEKVAMGRARVDTSLCLSYQGKTCGVCYRACPLPDLAIKTGRLEQPMVTEWCVGCGLCERSCIQIPQAIKIIPSHLLDSGAMS
jgi:ferredoxin-type protein NapG